MLCRSPSLDGPDPEGDPSVLVRTAIRVCRALTGVDLSGCTQWHRFLEIHYRRQETSSRPARTETTVIFLPDVWSVMPTRAEYIDTEARYIIQALSDLDWRLVLYLKKSIQADGDVPPSSLASRLLTLQPTILLATPNL